MSFAKAVYDVLAADTALTNQLAKYKAKPAIFTTAVAPMDAEYPLIVTSDAIADVPDNTKTHRARVHTRDVRCYAVSQINGIPASVIPVNGIAERVRFLFDNDPILVVPGYTRFQVSVEGGPIAVDDAEAYGRIVTVSIFAEQL